MAPQPFAAARSAFLEELKGGLKDALNKKNNAGDKIVHLASMLKATRNADMRVIVEALADVRSVRKELASLSGTDEGVVKRLDYLEQTLKDQTNTLAKKLDHVASVFEGHSGSRPIDVRQTMQRTFTDSLGRTRTQNVATGRFERPANKNEEKNRPDLVLLRSILDYEKKNYELGKRALVVSEARSTRNAGERVVNYHFGGQTGTQSASRQPAIGSRGYRGIQNNKAQSRDFGRGNVNPRNLDAITRNALRNLRPAAPARAPEKGLLESLLGDTGKNILSGAAGGAATTAFGFLRSRALPFLARRAGPAAAMLGLAQAAQSRNILAAPDVSKGGFRAFLEALDPNLAKLADERPTPAPVPQGANGPNQNLFRGLPALPVNPNRAGGAPVTSLEDAETLKKLVDLKKELEDELDDIKRKSPRRNFRNYRADQIQQQIQGITGQIESVQSGGLIGGGGGGSYGGGGGGSRAGGGRSGSAPAIPGVTPGLGQTAAQAQVDAQQRAEQAKMPAYNPQFSPGTAAGAGPMQFPGAGAAPSGVTGLPITFGGGGPQTTKDALTGKGQGVQTTSTGFFYPGKDVMGGQASVGAANEPDYTRLGQASKGANDYQAYAYQFYKSRGYSDDAAAIIMGQANAESRFDPRSLNPNDAPKNRGMTYDIGNGQTYSGADSIGLQQRNGGRAIGMIKNGEAMFGKKWSDMSNQERMYADLDYTDKELKGTDTTNPDGAGSHKKSGDMLNGPGSIADKAGAFGKRFEGYAGGVQSGRTADAIGFAEKAKSGGYGQDFSRGGGGPPITASAPGPNMPGLPRASMADIMPGATQGDAKNAMFATVNPNAAGGAVAGLTPSVVEKQQGKTRDLPIQDALRSQLQFAAEKTGLHVEIGSGGQTSERDPSKKNQPGGWTGSHRHDDGGAADLKLYETDANGNRRLLDMSNPADAAKMQAFTEATVRAGATGVGAGPGYMGNSTLHIGGGTVASWGGADWIANALKNGRANPEGNAKEYAEWQAARAAAQGQTANPQAAPGMPQAPGIPGAIAAGAAPNITMAPDAKAASIWSGQTAPNDLKGRTLGAQIKAYQAASQEKGIDNRPIMVPEKPATVVSPELEKRRERDAAASEQRATPPSRRGMMPPLSSPQDLFARNAAKASGGSASPSSEGGGDTDTDSKSATGSSATPSDSGSQRKATPDPTPAPTPAPSSPPPAVSKSDDTGSGGATKTASNDSAPSEEKSGKKMDEIEHSLNDFGLKSINTPSYA